MKKYVLLLATIVVVVSAGVFAYETTQEAPEACQLPSYEQSYFPSFEDYIGPCTYVQRVASDLIWIGLGPVFMWPITLCIVFYFTLSLVAHRSLKKIDYRPIILATICMILAWFLFLAFDALRFS